MPRLPTAEREAIQAKTRQQPRPSSPARATSAPTSTASPKPPASPRTPSSLRDGQERSDRYYHGVAAFTDEVLAEAPGGVGPLMMAFRVYLKRTGRETPRTLPEHVARDWHPHCHQRGAIAARAGDRPGQDEGV